ncbi:MAG: type 1 glutamine amidotransferase [Cyclobacteriaceae bacterium]|nr:type 1 glutamine amidotransferase [Cyclobacteriaceae bacterium]
MQEQTFNKRNGIMTLMLAFAFHPLVWAQQQATVEDMYRPSEPGIAKTKSILIITDQNYNDTELLYPLYRFVEEGYNVTVATLKGGEIAGYNSAGLKSTTPIQDVDVTKFDALYLPGGRAPAQLREHDIVINAVKHFAEHNKPIAAICHGPQLLAKSGLLQGKQVTAFHKIKDEMLAAGGNYVDQPVVKDGNILTSRMPGDLPAQIHEFMKMIK